MVKSAGHNNLFRNSGVGYKIRACHGTFSLCNLGEQISHISGKGFEIYLKPEHLSLLKAHYTLKPRYLKCSKGVSEHVFNVFTPAVTFLPPALWNLPNQTNLKCPQFCTVWELHQNENARGKKTKNLVQWHLFLWWSRAQVTTTCSETQELDIRSGHAMAHFHCVIWGGKYLIYLEKALKFT